MRSDNNSGSVPNNPRSQVYLEGATSPSEAEYFAASNECTLPGTGVDQTRPKAHFPSLPNNSFGRDRGTARATLGKGLAVSAFPLSVPVYAFSLAHGWDRDRARPAVGEGLPFPLFRLHNGITIGRELFPPSFGISCLRAGNGL